VLIVIAGLVGFFGAFAASGFGAALIALIGTLAGCSDGGSTASW